MRPIRAWVPRRARWLAVAALCVAAGLAADYLWAGAGIAAAFPAKTMCSCLFVERRGAEACREEVALQGFGWVALRPDLDGRSVEARALRLRSARAEHEERFGCTLR